MLYGLARNWWLVALRGAAGILFGILAFVWPGATLSALIMLLGAYLFIDGITTIAHSIVMLNNVQLWWLELIEGIATVLFGALTLFWPEITGLLLLSLIAIWSIITGVIEILAALRLRKVIDNEWSLIVAGSFSVLFGLLLLIFPMAGVISIAFIIGSYAIIFGVLTLMLAFRLRRFKNDSSLHHPMSGAI